MPLRDQLAQRQYELILDNLDEGVVIARPGGEIMFMNELARRFYGVEEVELQRQQPLNLQQHAVESLRVFTLDGDPLPDDHRPTSRFLRDETDQDETDQSVRILVQHPGEEERRMYVVSSRRIPGDAELDILTIRDDTDRWRAHQRFRVTFETDPAPSVVARLDDATILMANVGMSEMTHIRREELEGHSLADLELLEKNDALSATLEALRNEQRIHKHQTALKDASGTNLDVLVSARALELAGEACGIFTFVDISDFEATRREHQQSQQQLSHARSRLAQRREQQRIQLARDLHDGVLQDLLVHHTQLALHEKSFRQAGNQEAADALCDARHAALAIVTELRGAIRGLRPTAIRELGLWTSLRDSIPNQEDQTQILLPANEPPIMAEDVLLTLYRTAQEAIRNALKHAHASTIRVTLDINDNTATLRVIDDGRGFIPPARLATLEQDDHFGLISMEEHASSHGGVLNVLSAPGKGTTISLRLPLAPPDRD